MIAVVRPIAQPLTALALIERWARSTPYAPAIEAGNTIIDYGELDARAMALATELERRGVRSEVIVGVCLPRSADAVVALLAIHKAGGAYLPLDPELPAPRLAAMIADAGAAIVITSVAIAPLLPANLEMFAVDEWRPGVAGGGGAPGSLEARGTPPADALAYVIFTSGTTGRPKGVMVEHGALRNLVDGVIERYALTPRDRALQFTSLAFDISIEETLSALAAGATLVLRTDTMLASMSAFVEECRALRLTMLNLPTAFWHELADGVASGRLALPETVRAIIIGGERAQPARVTRWLDTIGDRVRLINAYGPTEATITATTCDLSALGSAAIGSEVPIGRSLGGVTTYVLDDVQHDVAASAEGELYIGGAGVARGYVGDPELTAERFVTLGRLGGAVRAYRTGDRVRARPDGELLFLGRVDRQVKIRGHRIELGEIEASLEAIAHVRDSVVVTRERADAGPELVAFVRAAEDRSLDADELRRVLGRTLPPPMVPAELIVVPEWPRTVQGKIDQRALLALASASPSVQRGTAPATATQRTLAAIWRTLLDVREIGVDDDFFDLGGHSLMAMQLVARVEDELGVDVPAHALFTTRTLGALASHIDTLRVVERDEIANKRAPSSSIVRRDPVLSIEQEAWLMRGRWEELHGLHRKAFHIHSVSRLSGELDVALLERAFGEVVRRHEALRTTFVPVRGLMTHDAFAPLVRLWLAIPGMVQRVYQGITERPLTRRPSALIGDYRPVIARPPAHVALPVIDLRTFSTDSESTENEAMRLIGAEYERGLDHWTGPMLRALLVRTGEKEYVLSVLMHHLAADGWSIDILLDELGTLYAAYARGRPSPLPALEWQFNDFAWWQRERLGAEVERTLPHWRRHFATVGLFPELALPFARPGRLARDHYARGRRHTMSFGAELTREVRAMCRREGVTLFTLMLAALQALLHRYTRRADLGILAPLANRRRPQTRRLIGWVDNVCVLTAHMTDDTTFAQLVDGARRQVIDSIEHQEIPYSLIHLMLLPNQSAYRMTADAVDAPFVYFDVRPRVTPPQRMPGVTLTPVEVPDTAVNSGIELVVIEHTDHFDVTIQYSLERFESESIQAMASDFGHVLARAATHRECTLRELLEPITVPSRATA